MAGRRTRAWATPVDDGDAAAAMADIDRWRQAEAARARDFEGVMRRIRDRLALLWLSPLLRGDPACRAILEGMVSCRDMDAFEAEVARLQARVGEIVAARAAAKAPAPTPSRVRPNTETPQATLRRQVEPGAARAWHSILRL